MSAAFSRRCTLGEENLKRQLAHERDMAVDNFDSGVPFEGAVREEIGRLIPQRYTTTSGVLVDRNGFSSGQCDIVIFNGLWFSAVNAPTQLLPARLLIPIEGVYAVGEVKQRLSRKTLDDGMEKLVMCQRLHRPPTFANRLVENRESDPCPHGLTNPLFTFLIAGGIGPSDFQSLIRRFYETNKKLKRLEVVRFLCVLGAGAVSWIFFDSLRNNEIRPALFMRDDLFHSIHPGFAPCEKRPPLFSLMQALQLHLFHSVLAPEDLATAYGTRGPHRIVVPAQKKRFALPPDEEWLKRLRQPCKARHEE